MVVGRSTLAGIAAVVALLNCWAMGSASGAFPRSNINTTYAISGTYVPLSPARIEDTRPRSGYPGSGVALGPAGTLNVQVTGLAQVPATGVSAAVLNVTAVDTTASTYLTAYPQGTTRPIVSNLNVASGQNLTNLVTVPVGAQGGVTIFNHAGTANVVVDLDGYYTSTPQATGLYNPVNPLRVFGTLASGNAIGTGVSSAVAVTGGSTGVPADASAVVVNVTAAGSTEASFLTVYPEPNSGTPTPPTSANLNFDAGQIIGNRVVVPAGKNGDIELYNHAGSVNVDVDLYGYYTGMAGELGSGFVPLSPTRFVDTRVSRGGSIISGVNSENFDFISDGIPITATAIAAGVTVVPGNQGGYLAIYPTIDSAPPGVGDLAFPAGTVTQSFSQGTLNSASIKIFNSSATPVDVVIDAFGYFAPPPPAVRVVANPAVVAANGSSTSAVTVTVTTGSGVAFDDPVSITTAPSAPGSCGTASATGSTNASGQVTSTYTASTSSGTCTITATEANGGTIGSVVITQN